jgi:hypothetical protein
MWKVRFIGEWEQVTEVGNGEGCAEIVMRWGLRR